MHKYQRWFKQVERILGMSLKDFFSGEVDYLKLKSSGFMDLNIDRLTTDSFSLAHNFIQNGDVMADPDMVIKVDLENEILFPMTFQQDSLSLYQEAYKTDEQGNITHFVPEIRKSMESFFNLWLRNIIAQGHKV